MRNEKPARIGERIVSLGGDSGAGFSFLIFDFVLYHSLSNRMHKHSKYPPPRTFFNAGGGALIEGGV